MSTFTYNTLMKFVAYGFCLVVLWVAAWVLLDKPSPFFSSCVAITSSILILIVLAGRVSRAILLTISVYPLCFLVFVAFVENSENTKILAILFAIGTMCASALIFIENLKIASAVVATISVSGVSAIELGPRLLKYLEPEPTLGAALSHVDSIIRDTHFGRIRMRFLTAPVVAHPGIYTYLTMYGDTIIWVDAHGNFYAIEADESFRKLNIHLESNERTFLSETAPNLQLHRFSVKDIAVYEERLYVSHLIYDNINTCYQLRVTFFGINADALQTDDWPNGTTLYTSIPCIPINTDTVEGQLMESGGRLAFRGNFLFLTNGDHMYDGRALEVDRARPIFAQDPTVHYGKTMKIDLDTGFAEIFTMGHRNPQGLHISATGDIWLTEHGPKGGDELNKLVEGKNYGWPLVTYGTQYNQYDWIHKYAPNGEHFGFETPEYIWIPSIGISASLEVRDGGFREWEGDVLVTSLRARSIFRTRLREGKVVSVEPIEIGYPIRDILELPDGRIALSTTSAVLIVIEPLSESIEESDDVTPIAQRLASASVERGQRVYESQCAACHGNDPAEVEHGAGPSLTSVFTKVNRRELDFSYSSAFLDRDIVWTDADLDTWLADPAKFLPGTTMISSLSDPSERADVISYLKNALIKN